MGEGCMRRNVTVQTVIVHFYELFLKKKPPDNETIAKANKVIEKCNRHLMEHGDRYITDKVKLIETEDDYNCWMKVFALAKDSALSLQSNTQFEEKLFHAILTDEQYLYQALKVHITPARYYDREKKVFCQIIHYLYYFHLITLDI